MEKYEIKRRDWDRADSLAPFIAQVNQIRREHPAFRWLRNVRFHHSTNDRFLAYSKRHGDDVVLVVVNLDPATAHETILGLDLGAMGLPNHGPYRAHDELTGDTYTWNGHSPYVRLDPTSGQVAHVLTFPR